MIVEMKKLYLLAHKSKKGKILNALYRSKFVEIAETREIEDAKEFFNTESIEAVEGKLNSLSQAINFIESEKREGKKQVKLTKKSKDKFLYTPIKVKISEKISRLHYDEFSSYKDKERELFEVVGELEEINSRYAAITGQEARLLSLKGQIEAVSKMNLKFNIFGDTDFTTAFYGYVPCEKKELVKVAIEKIELPYECEFFEGDKFIPIAFLSLKENVDEIVNALQPFEFVRMNLNFDMTPAEKIVEIDKELSDLAKERLDLLGESLSREIYFKDLKILYDYYLVEFDKLEAESKFKNTDSVFVLEGWYPVDREEKLKGILDIVCDELVYELIEPTEGDDVPTLVRSAKLVEPFEDVTNMYSPINYFNDFDSNPIMAFFYFLFFGMMLADAGYGILLAIGGLILLKVTKPVPGKGRLIMIVTLGGISTIIWGTIFGGWFGIDLGLLEIESPFLSALIGVSLFQPLSEPLTMLIVCLALGAVQIIVGLILNAYNLFRKAMKHKDNKTKRDGCIVEAFASSISWLSVFLGIGLIALGLFTKINLSLYFGIAFAAAGVLTILVCNAIVKKSPLGFITGIGKLYDGVNFVSDILSYARLFGLGLAGGVVAMVVNMLAHVLIGMIPIKAIGVIISIPIFIVGHVFNLAISALGAYVHDCRLQFIEFYGKFYEGGGRLFKPLGSITKYTYIDM